MKSSISSNCNYSVSTFSYSLNTTRITKLIPLNNHLEEDLDMRKLKHKNSNSYLSRYIDCMRRARSQRFIYLPSAHRLEFFFTDSNEDSEESNSMPHSKKNKTESNLSLFNCVTYNPRIYYMRSRRCKNYKLTGSKSFIPNNADCQIQFAPT